jgi:alpha-beta hydrolase superfamily lysophospholipase
MPPERFVRSWASTEPKAAVALVHGLAEHSARYEHVGRAFAEAGYTVRAVDIRGHGRSRGFPGKVSGLAQWHDDTAAVLEEAAKAALGMPVFLLGHSLGSLITGSFVASSHPDIRGFVISGYAGLPGPAVLESMSDPEGGAIPPDLVSRDPAVVKAYVDDPLVFYEQVPVECSAVGMEAAIGANTGAPSIGVPVLMVHGGADAICDVQGARDFHEALGSTDKELIVYDGLYHEVLNEPERDRVIGDIVAWLDRHTE